MNESTSNRGFDRKAVGGFFLLVLIYAAIAHLLPCPRALTPVAWRLLGIFVATIVGLILQPMPGGAIVLLAVTAVTIVGGLSPAQALAGYADPTVWLVLAAFFISRALINTGLARRIALHFVRLFGQSSLGVCYALSSSDMVLATIIPSNAARSGGVILPIVRAIAELYGSQPGATASLLGSFLVVGVYQSICVTAAMFFTGQASNPLAAQIAGQQFGLSVTWSSWFLAGLVPGLCSLIIIPLLVQLIYPPKIRKTPEATAFARGELHTMGPTSQSERILAVVFLAVCSLWVTSGWHKIDITVTALAGSAVLLITGVLRWEDVKSERSAWDIFIWYGGLLRLGKALGEAGVTEEFARVVGSQFEGAAWPWVFVGALLIYFYAHYGFASITTHILSMFGPFGALLIGRGVPRGLIVYGLACCTNLAAGLTHYGTTPSPMFYAQGYVPLTTWWKIGAIASLANLAIWTTIGFGYWKVIGLW